MFEDCAPERDGHGHAQHLGGLRLQVPVERAGLARALVGRGLGYSVLAQRPSNERTYEGLRVVCKEIAEHVGEVAVLLAWPRHSRLSARAGAFIDYATDPTGFPPAACPR